MPRESLAAVVLASGWGTITPGQSKLVEPVSSKTDGMPIVARIIDLAKNQLNVHPTLVVINEDFGHQVKAAIPDYPPEYFIHQQDRTGAAGAVKHCLPVLRKLGVSNSEFEAGHLLVLYGDMPLWRVQSIEGLITSHLDSPDDPAISMFSILIGNGCPTAVKKFGRILRDDRGSIIAIREPYEMKDEEARNTKTVNPSAWVFDIAWLEENLPGLSPHDKGDGFSHEWWLPDLVPLAVKQGRNVNEVHLLNAWEALGVNTLTDLEEVRSFWAEQFG